MKRRGGGLHRRWGGPFEEMRPGDVVSVARGEKHWHDAGPATAMTDFAIQEAHVEGEVIVITGAFRRAQ